MKALSKPRTGMPTEGETKVRHIGARRVGAAGREGGEDDAPVIVGKIVKAKADEVWEEVCETHE